MSRLLSTHKGRDEGSTNEQVLTTSRIMLLICVAVFPLFGALHIVIDSTVTDPMAARFLIAGLAALMYGVSYTSAWVREHINTFIVSVYYLLTFHFLLLLVFNQLNINYLIGFFLVLFCVGAAFITLRSLLYYCTFLTTGTFIVSLIVETHHVHPLFLLGASFTVSLISYVTLRFRLKATEALSLTNHQLRQEITDRTQAEEALQYQLEFEKLIASLSRHFINLRADEIDGEISQALQTIGEFAGVDRSYVFLFSENLTQMSNTHEWCALGINSYRHQLQEIPVGAFPWCMTQLKRLAIVHVARVADLPSEASVEKAEFQRAGTRSLILVPMVSGGSLLGFLGFDAVQEEKIWSEESVQLLSMAGEIFANALTRKQVEQLKDELVSTVSHELRTPLTSLRGFAELMLKRSFSPEKQQQFLSTIHSEAIRLTNLINDFLDLQRIEAGRQRYAFENIELSSFLQESVTVFLSAEGHHTFHLNLADSLPFVRADGERLRQVLANLLSNAIKFSPQGGTITTGAYAEEDEVIVWVADQGVGIPPEAMPKLFGKFFRVDNRETRSIGGTGLGLALVKKIVQAHGGRVWVESAVGRGSTFFFSLPIAGQAPSVSELQTDVVLI